MKFETASTLAVDEMKILGKATSRVEGPLKVTGHAPYAHEQDVGPDIAYGYVVASAIAKGRIAAMDMAAAKAAPGVLAIVNAANAGPVGKGQYNTAKPLGGPEIQHYHQAIAIVVAGSFEQARAAAQLIKVDYVREAGRFDLAAEKPNAKISKDQADVVLGDFDTAFAAAPHKIDADYHTPDQSHSMIEPHATIAKWEGDKLTLWTSNQMISWSQGEMAKIMGMDAKNIRLISPYIGGGFGAKLFVRADAVLAALGARAAGRPVKLALPRPLIANNTTHRPATMQRIRIGAGADGKITAFAHESWSGDLPGGGLENAIQQSTMLYAGANRKMAARLAVLDLPEGNAMRAPGEASGMMALEIAIDEIAEKLGIDPVEFRIRNDTQVVPNKEAKPFSARHLIECMRLGAERFGWDKRPAQPASVRDGRWLVGMGMSAGYRGAPVMASAARVRLTGDGGVVVETDMTDIGTGSYTVIAQTAAEIMGVPLDRVHVVLGDSDFPVSAGSGGQWGAASSTAGVYAACMKLRQMVAEKFGMDAAKARFADGQVLADNRKEALAKAGQLVAEETMEFGSPHEKYQQSTFAAHFVEAAVDSLTGEIRLRRMLAVCDAGKIMNPKAARSQVIGAMTMGVGAALTEELVVDKRFGFFVNHDLAGYEVPVHADIPDQEVIFLNKPDPLATPLQAKGVGELGLCGSAAAIANAVYNATGIRVRNYPITPDKLIASLPGVQAS